MAALAWTEVLTQVTPSGVSDAAYNEVLKEFTPERAGIFNCSHRGDQCMEQSCDGVSLHAADTTRRSASVERNVPACANFFAVEADNFCSSPLMVQLNFFER
jgi:hypothetical protein